MTVGGWTMASRILGFVRDIMIGAFLGSSAVAEAFLIAFSLPNMFRRFFAEGTLNVAFVPMFAKKHEGQEGALEFARDAFSGLAFILVIFSIIAQIFMPALVYAMASGFTVDDRFDLAVTYGRIAFPYILFISLAALLSGVLNATGRFVAAAAAPVLLNVIFIAAMLGADLMGIDIGTALAWTVPVAGVAQVALVWVAASRAGYRLIPRVPHMTPELKRLAIIAAPAALAGGVVQINLLVGRQVASFFDGAVAWLNYADRLYQLPLGVVGIAIGVVLLPDLSRRLRAGDTTGGQNAFNRACEITLALTIPAAVALMIIPVQLVSVLFERGAFDSADTQATAMALRMFAFGLPAFVLIKVLTPAFFARENTKTPMIYAGLSAIINLGLGYILFLKYGFWGLAIATSVAGWVNVFFLTRTLLRTGGFAPDKRLLTRLPRILLASIVMGGAVWWLADTFTHRLDGSIVQNYLWLVLVSGAGLVLYALAALALRAYGLNDLRLALGK